VPQNPLIIESLTIGENVRLVSPDSSAEAIEQALRELGLERPLNMIAGALSRGEQRRVAIARAILKKPRLLLLDEPDVWLDIEGRASLARALDRQLAERAVIVVSHRNDWLSNDRQVIDLEPQIEAVATAGTKRA
jgi:ABC-type transport system involved in cytochrome bd biosynthesis fused ATPase/permease subunit